MGLNSIEGQLQYVRMYSKHKNELKKKSIFTNLEVQRLFGIVETHILNRFFIVVKYVQRALHRVENC